MGGGAGGTPVRDGGASTADVASSPDARPNADARPTVAADLMTRTFTSPTTGLTLPYRLFVPRGYDPAKRVALLLFLHGAGERGTNNTAQLGNGGLAFTQPGPQSKQPTIVVLPQCPSGAQWVDTPWGKGSYSTSTVPLSKPLATALELLTAVEKEFSVDPKKILITGLSMGGYGTWDAIVRDPTRFAGAMAVCGAGDPSKADLIKTLPLWVHHGSADGVVPVSGSRDMVNALKAAGSTVQYTEYAGLGHNAWDRAYTNPMALDWLLAQSRP
jgi:predicted peptidase